MILEGQKKLRVHFRPCRKENYNSHDTLVRAAGAVSFLALSDALVVTRVSEQIGHFFGWRSELVGDSGLVGDFGEEP